MAERSISIKLDVNTSGMTAGLSSATSQLRGVRGELGTIGKLAGQQATGFNELGKAGLAIGAGAAAGATLAVKAAISYESAFAGVRKTVDATEVQYEALSAGIRAMARELPASAVEIAGVAEAAGQLGVKQESILGFTRVMIDLGETTNLSATEAATSLARFSNIMGTSAEDTDRLGSTIVELGNNSATTESEILELATRLAAAGSAAGLSEADVFSFASTLTSVGVEAEAGGTALSKVFTKISDSVIDGGDDLRVFAGVAGASTEDFKRAFEEDAAGAIAMFIDGLGKLRESGESTTGVFKSLKLEDQRLMRALLSTAGAGSLLTDQLALGNAAWKENTALTDEAAQRYGTTEAQLEMLKNQVVDVAIDFGEQLLPALVAATGALGDVTSAVGDVLDKMGPAGPVLAGLAATVGLLGGGFLLLAPRVVAAQTALASIRTGAPILTGALGGVAKAAGGVAVAFAAIQAVDAWAKASANVPGIQGLTASLLDLESSTKAAGDLAVITGDNFELLGHKIEIAGNSPFSVFDSAGIREVQEANAQIDALDKSLASLLARDPEQARELFSQLTSAAVDQGASIEQVNDRFNDYNEALKGAEVDSKLLSETTTTTGEAVGALADPLVITEEALKAEADALEAAEKATREWQETLGDAYGAFTEGTGLYQEILAEKTAAEQEAAQATADATDDQEDSWDDYADAVDVTIGEIIGRLEDQVAAQEDWRSDLASIALAGREDVAAELAKMGPEGAALVKTFADSTESEMNRAGDLLVASASDGGERAGQALETELAAMAIIGRGGAKATARAVADELNISVGDVQRIASRYGVVLAEGINPLLAGMGRPRVFAGSLVKAMAEGGHVPGVGDQDTVPAMLMPGEFVVRKAAVRALGVDALQRINRADLRHYAVGGFVTPGDVPAPPSVAHRGPVVGYAGAQSMDVVREQARLFVEANAVQTASASASGLSPAFAAMFNRYNQALGGILSIVSGFRSSAAQAVLYARYLAGTGNLAAPPGRSNHERGLAIDHAPRSTAGMRNVARGFGLHYPVGGEPWHVEPVSIRDRGGPLLPGLTWNGTGRPETVVPHGTAAIDEQALIRAVRELRLPAPDVRVSVGGKELRSDVEVWVDGRLQERKTTAALQGGGR